MAANALADRLVDGMGFDPLDLASMIAPQLPLGFGHTGKRDDGPLFAAAPLPNPWLPALTVDLAPDKPLPPAVARAVADGQIGRASCRERV